MARRRVKSRKKRGFTLPIALVAGFGAPVSSIIIHTTQGGFPAGLREASRIMIGWDNETGQWNWGHLKFGLMPILLGGLIHKFVGGRLGVNRYLANSGIPIVRL